MSSFDGLTGRELITLASVLSFQLSQGLNPAEIAIVGSFFNMIGDNLATLSAVQANNELLTDSNCPSKQENLSF